MSAESNKQPYWMVTDAGGAPGVPIVLPSLDAALYQAQYCAKESGVSFCVYEVVDSLYVRPSGEVEPLHTPEQIALIHKSADLLSK